MQSLSSSLLTFSLSPHALSVSPTLPFCLSLYHSDHLIPTSSSLLLLLSLHPSISSPPYTSTHHPSSSLFCCYIIATITTTSTMQSLTPPLLTFSLSPQALSVSPTLLSCLSLYHSDLPIPSSPSFLLLSLHPSISFPLPYTSTHHPSSSLFCCYIISTITIPSTPQALSSSLLTFSLSPQALSVSPTLPSCLSLYHSDHPISLSLPLTSLQAPSHLPPPLPPARHKKIPDRLFSLSGTLIKEGGVLLSRIALQYHRRRRA